MSVRPIILLIVVLFPFSVLAQKTENDTIPYGTSPSKSSENVIWETRADSAITLVINEFLAQNSDLVFDNFGDDDDWFEIYNYGDDPVLLNKIWFTDDPATPLHWKIDTTAPVYLFPGEFYLFWADGEPEEGANHANFKISGDGEYLGIYSSDLQPIDEVVFQQQSPNISFGRSPDAGLSWVFFDTPTPGEHNDDSGGGSVLPAPASNKPGGVYEGPLNVELSAPVAGAEIRYTLDASNPDRSSILYDEPIQVDSTTILKARLFREGDLEGPILTCSYFINIKEYTNPIVSIVARHNDLYGSNGLIQSNSPSLEISAHFEYIEDRQSKYASGTGIQLHSINSGKPTSMRFYARSRYGNDWFGYPFFNDQAPTHFKRLVLRNSGNDNVNKAITNLHFRDLLIQEIARRSLDDPLLAAGKPVNVFLNGKYFGIFNMRERIDRFYIESHMDKTEDFDLLERAFGFPLNQNPITGSFDKWNKLMAFVDTNGNLAHEEDYEYLASQVDLNNFTNYWMTEVFVGNYDWLSNNVKFWKHEDGKWQWIFWDMDHGLGLKFNDYGYVSWNTLEWSLTTSDRAWSTGYNNRLIRNLLRNEQYRDHFIKHFATLLNTSFAYSSTKPVVDSIRRLYENDMVHHASRWDNNIKDWESAGDTLVNYLQKRPEMVFRHLEEFFELDEAVDVSLGVIPEGAGDIYWAEEKIPGPEFKGRYFPELDYIIDAEAIPGFRLSHWTLNGDSTALDNITFSGPVEIKAYFRSDNNALPVQVTELYSNNRHYFDCGDWIEFYYYGFRPLNLSGSELLDGNDNVLFRFSEETYISQGTYFVIAEDREAFYEIFPDSVTVFGDLQGRFEDQPKIRLRLSDGSVVGPVKFMNSPSWPELPAEGYSLELKQPVNDPETGINWELSQNRFGSPGLSNSQHYDFHRPEGRDSIFSNREPCIIRFTSSNDFYSDADGHELAGIRVIRKTGPGKLLYRGSPITGSAILESEDLHFEPDSPFEKSTTFVYRLIDRSGESSEEFTLDFIPETEVWERIETDCRIYPNPARDQLFIETGIAFMQPGEFILLDITGKQVLQHRIARGEHKITVNISGIEPGMYIYILQTAGKYIYGKTEVIR